MQLSLTVTSPPQAKNRDLPIGMLTSILSAQTGHNVQPGNMRTELLSIFGADSSAMVLQFAQMMGLPSTSA